MTLLEKFKQKWCQRDSGFIKPLCHIDDVVELLAEVIGSRKSVVELEEFMGDAYSSPQGLSVRVAFKEGYNKAIVEQRKRAGLVGDN